MSDTLMPCPFCGGEAQWISGGEKCWWSECLSCCAQSDAKATKADAIAAWSRRAEPATPDRERLEAAIATARRWVLPSGGSTDWIKTLADFAEASFTADQWQTIESAPKDAKPVLLAVEHRDGTRLVGEAYWSHHDDGAWWWANENWGDYNSEPIHMRFTILAWRPLPAPPEAK